MRFEYAETRAGGEGGGLVLRRFFIGHPIGGAAQSYGGRIRYHFTPSHWIAADGRYERYGLQQTTGVTTQQRIGLEMSGQLKVWKQALRLGGRLEYARLGASSSGPQQAVFLSIKVSARRK